MVPSGPSPPVWVVCGGVGSQWPGMLTQLSQHPLCASILEEITELLGSHGFELTTITMATDSDVFDRDPRNLFVGLAVLQCLQIEMIKTAGIKISGVLGHSFGEHAAAFVAGCLTREQFILSALARGRQL